MRRGFTLVELVIVIVVLGILAAVAIPRFVDLGEDARRAATRGSLGGLRSATAIFYAQQAILGTARFPTSTAELEGAMAQGIPPNPYVTGAASIVVTPTGAVPTATAANAAWIYGTAIGNTASFGRVWAAATATTF